MLKFLLDTHAFLWWMFDDPKLPPRVRAILADRDHEVWVSAASAWEISTKFRLGKLPAAKVLAQDIIGWIERAGFQGLAIHVEHAQKAGAWQQEHRDPFDRMLAAQSSIEGLPLISRDPAFEAFGIATIW